jgi:hypothetical protein
VYSAPARGSSMYTCVWCVRVVVRARAHVCVVCACHRAEDEVVEIEDVSRCHRHEEHLVVQA